MNEVKGYKGFLISKTMHKPKAFIRENPYCFFLMNGGSILRYAETVKEAKDEIDLFNKYGIEKAIKENKL